MDQEIIKLEKLAHYVFVYLVLGSILSLYFGNYILFNSATGSEIFIGYMLLGYCGSAVAALTSSLDRYAKGFERESGEKYPEGISGETFNRRMARWFFIRPFLGAIVAPIFLSAIAIFASEPDKLINATGNIAFSAFMGGFLAKSVLDLIKGLFKNIFKT